MTPKERSATLKKEADELLERIELATICEPVGKLMPTGSYLQAGGFSRKRT